MLVSQHIKNLINTKMNQKRKTKKRKLSAAQKKIAVRKFNTKKIAEFREIMSEAWTRLEEANDLAARYFDNESWEISGLQEDVDRVSDEIWEELKDAVKAAERDNDNDDE